MKLKFVSFTKITSDLIPVDFQQILKVLTPKLVRVELVQGQLKETGKRWYPKVTLSLDCVQGNQEGPVEIQALN